MTETQIDKKTKSQTETRAKRQTDKLRAKKEERDERYKEINFAIGRRQFTTPKM